MPREKSIARYEHKIITNSFNSHNNNHESLGADQEEAFEAHALTHNVASSTVMSQHRVGDPFTGGSFHSQIQGAMER